MPIKPENRRRYPRDWRAIAVEVKVRAGWVCEGSPAYPDCRAVHGHPHPITNSVVVLTCAHLNHAPEDNGEPGDRPNLRAWCQRCHNTYDLAHRLRNAAATRRAAKSAAQGELKLSDA